MDSHREMVTGQTQRPIASEAAVATRGLRITSATIFLVAIWVGLTAGFLDLGLMVFRKRLTDDVFYRLGDHFRWIIPSRRSTALACPRDGPRSGRSLARRTDHPGVVVGCLSFVGFLDVCAGSRSNFGRL